MSTPVGHSDLQLLQERHRSSASFTASLLKPSVMHLALQHLEQQPRAAARRVLLVAGRHVGRAHRPAVGLAALPHADAAHAPRRRRLPSPGTRNASHLGRVVLRRRAGARRGGTALITLPGFIRLPGSQTPLNCAERLHQLGAVHPRQQLAARLPVAVLAGERAAVARRRGPRPRRRTGGTPRSRSAVFRSKSMRVCTQPWPKWP